MTKKILCAIDSSQSSQKAAAFAARLASQLGGELTYLTIRTMDPEHAAKERYWDSQVLGAAELRDQEALHQASELAKAAGLGKVSCVEAYGRDIGAAIVSYADKEGYEQIVTGSSGKSGLERLVLGSVAAEVAAHAHCPVTIVP